MLNQVIEHKLILVWTPGVIAQTKKIDFILLGSHDLLRSAPHAIKWLYLA
jgi:hypothetical protein